MSRFRIAVIVSSVFHFTLITTALADADAEKYVDDALPLMYYSCSSVVKEAAGNEAYVESVIRSLAAVSLYNRDVKVTMFDISDEAKGAMHDKFVEALTKGCEADNNALLAGVIDHAIADALAEAK